MKKRNMASKRNIQDKIRATGNIRQITRAMELVAATKMRKAEFVALRSRPFAKNALRILSNLLTYAKGEQVFEESFLLKRNLKGHTALLLITSDKGLSGSYNTAVLRSALKVLKENPEVRGVAVGRKAASFLEKNGIATDKTFFQFSDVTSLEEVLPIAEFLLAKYEKGDYQKVITCSTFFLSALNQKVEVREILPLTVEKIQEFIEGIVPERGKYAESDSSTKLSFPQLNLVEEGRFLPYIVELPFEELFGALLRQLFWVEVLHLMLEANASEHSARMIAMKNATDNADDILGTLTLQLHKARQAAITQELAEVSTAKEALTSE